VTLSPSVMATINYCGTEGLRPKLKFDLTDVANSVSGPRDSREVTIRNARQAEDDLSFDGSGFTLITTLTAVSDFDDPDQIENIYYPEVEDLLKRMLGAEDVFVFGHIHRTDEPEATRERMESKAPLDRSRSGPAGGAHVDFDQESVETYVEELAGDRAESLSKKWVVNVNLWRGTSKVQRMPLALCDGSTAERDQMIPVDMYNAVGPNSTTKVGLNLQYNPAHRWYSYPEMTPDEVLVFKTYDSDPAGGSTPCARWAARISTLFRIAGARSTRGALNVRPRQRQRCRAGAPPARCGGGSR
jgi:hypothetical protein